MKELKYILLMLGMVSIGWSQSPNTTFVANVNNYSSVGYNDCWGYTAPNGNEYALLGVLNGTSIIDVTNPQSIQEIDFVPGPSSFWKDIKTYQHYAYVVTEQFGGMQILDLSFLPDSVHLAAVYTGFQASHNIFIDSENGLLYAEGISSNPVRILSIDNAEQPVQISSFGLECHDMFVRDTLAFIAEGTQGSIGIYSVTDPFQPSLVQRLIIPAGGYAHNVWTDPSNTLMATTEETAGKTVKFWDISDLNNISFLGEYLGGSGLAHNVFLMGHYAYISHYESGLKIVDFSDPTMPVEAGYYDTYPQGEGPNFNGAWGAFPYSGNGMIFISDRDNGLTIVTFDSPAVAISDPTESVPTFFALEQNYPNPFNPITSIKFQVPTNTNVTLRVFNILGREIRTLVNEYYASGEYTVKWDSQDNLGNKVPSGMYFYRLETDSYSQIKKMILTK
jgi:choice-of-anchor B domain-containing protein